jgi:hypothetical protein
LTCPCGTGGAGKRGVWGGGWGCFGGDLGPFRGGESGGQTRQGGGPPVDLSMRTGGAGGVGFGRVFGGGTC